MARDEAIGQNHWPHHSPCFNSSHVSIVATWQCRILTFRDMQNPSLYGLCEPLLGRSQDLSYRFYTGLGSIFFCSIFSILVDSLRRLLAESVS
jgi:hypothetical protein